MKEIKAIIQPHMLSNVVRALHALPHFPGFTITDARGQGRGRGAGGSFKVTEDDIDYHRRTVLEIVCSDSLVESITETIRQAAHTGRAGDGIITVGSLEGVLSIRSGETHDDAV